ncbi:MAG: hypothetical protein O9325_11340, partial [Roseomonas sp.]|nr:hypothetical protein [Roseomonas sp.]
RAVATDVPTPDGIAPNTASFAVASSPDAPAGFKRPFLGSDTASLQVSSGLDFAIGARAGGSLFGNDIDPENAPFRAPQAPPIFTGTATPGAVVQLAIRDQNGRPLAVTSSSADASGAWLIRGPDPIGPQGDLPTADDFVPSRGGLSLARADSVPQTAGLNNAPFSVVAQGTNPMIGTDAPAADGIRLSYAGTGGIANGVFIGGSDQVSTAAAGTTGTAVARDLAGLTAPQSLAWNRFALDFVAATASPSAAR